MTEPISKKYGGFDLLFVRLTQSMALVTGMLLVSCGTAPKREIVVSVREQKIALLEKGEAKRVYPCSTSKFGLGDRPGSNATPLGKLSVAQKIGHNAPLGAVFKGRRPTGEVLAPNAPGRDPVVTRIMRLSGRQKENRMAFSRYIYIHGTPEERTIGRPASFGCVRMTSQDVVDLFNLVPEGTQVRITKDPLPSAARQLAKAQEKAARERARQQQQQPPPMPAAPAIQPEPVTTEPLLAQPAAEKPGAPKVVQVSAGEKFGPGARSATVR